MRSNTKKVLLLGICLVTLIAISPTVSAQQTEETGTSSEEAKWIAMSAGLAIAVTGLAAAWAEKEIGSAAVAAMTENPDFKAMDFILFVALPETIVVFGLVISYLLVGNLEG